MVAQKVLNHCCRGSSPCEATKKIWKHSRGGLCDGLKIRRNWFDSNCFHKKTKKLRCAPAVNEGRL